jgi:hypothetical protein
MQRHLAPRAVATLILLLSLVALAPLTERPARGEVLLEGAAFACVDDIKSALAAKFSAEAIQNVSVEVSTNVVLSGTVTYDSTKRAIVRTVKGVACVKGKQVNADGLTVQKPVGCGAGQEMCCTEYGGCSCVTAGRCR